MIKESIHKKPATKHNLYYLCL